MYTVHNFWNVEIRKQGLKFFFIKTDRDLLTAIKATICQSNVNSMCRGNSRLPILHETASCSAVLGLLVWRTCSFIQDLKFSLSRND